MGNTASDERWYTTRGLVTEAVTNMSNMFKGATTFNKSLMRNFLSATAPNENNWKVAKVTDMTSMFESAEAFVGTGISNWDVTELAKKTQSMFKNAKNFNTDIAKTTTEWVVTGVTDMSSMF